MTSPKCSVARRPSLPEGTLPRGFSRAQAAEYVGVSVTTFDTMVEDGRMPQPKHIGARRVWDRNRIDQAFDAMPGDDHHDDIWDHIAR